MSSEIMDISCSTQSSAIFSSSALSKTMPVGLHGELMMRPLVRLVIASATMSAWSFMPVGLVSMMTALAPVISTMGG